MMQGASDRIIGSVTSSDDEFISWLLPGDILLFDSAFVTSALIKFADNSPVNHCALYLGDKQFAHVTHPHGGTKEAVQPVELPTRLGERTDYSVMAFRHLDADSDDGAPGVVERYKAFLAGQSSYAYLNLIALFVPAFLRSYRPHMDPDGAMAHGLERAETAFLRSMVFETEASYFSPSNPAAKTMTCSQFVYLCYAGASPPLRLVIRDPLVRYKQFEGPVVRGDEGTSAPAGMVGLDFHPALLQDPDDLPETVRGDQHLNWQLAKAAVKLITNMCWHNRVFGSSDNPPKPGEVVAELVTPRDLWSSPSVVSPGVLVRPPGEGPSALLAET